jgi:hypothetical protein
MDPKDKPISVSQNPQTPLAFGRKIQWKPGRRLATFRQDTHKSNDGWPRGLTRERVGGRQAEHVTATANHHLGTEW